MVLMLGVKRKIPCVNEREFFVLFASPFSGRLMEFILFQGRFWSKNFPKLKISCENVHWNFHQIFIRKSFGLKTNSSFKMVKFEDAEWVSWQSASGFQIKVEWNFLWWIFIISSITENSEISNSLKVF